MSIFPVSTSTLSSTQLGHFIKDKYALHDNYKCTLFRTGVNHTYFISDNKTKYVVRVYCYKWRTKTEIHEELRLINLLRSNNLAVSYPIPDKHENLIQEIDAPEGLRYVVLFSFAEGDKIRFMSNETCSAVGVLMAKFHNHTALKKQCRTTYDSEVLLTKSYISLESFFSANLEAMKYLQQVGRKISDSLERPNIPESQAGIVHLDIWYDNFSTDQSGEITLFDFDNCGNGLLILDVGYFCKQLFIIESDKKEYELKVQCFLEGYQKERSLSGEEINSIPLAGAAVYIHYLGIQASRFDWSNIFLSENYLTMMAGRIKAWLDYHKIGA